MEPRDYETKTFLLITLEKVLEVMDSRGLPKSLTIPEISERLGIHFEMRTRPDGTPLVELHHYDALQLWKDDLAKFRAMIPPPG